MANVIRSLRSLTPSLEDADLVLAARTGESWAREALFRRHLATVHGLAFRLLGPHPSAREVVQASFTEAFRSLPQLGDPAALMPWLLRVTVGAARARLGRQRFAWRRLSVAAPDFAGLRSQLVFAGSIEQRNEVVAFYEGLESLPSESRLAILLHELEGMNTQDAAYCLQVPAARVRRALGRAERGLKALGATARAPSLLRVPSDELPVPLSEFERAQLFRRIEAGLAGSARSRWPSRATWAAAVLGLVVGLGLGWRGERSSQTNAVAVAMNEAAPRILELPDGSRASLSAAAELRVDAAEHARIRLTLVAGRADFELASRDGTEFVVRAGDTEIKGLGRALSVAIESAGASTAKTVEVQATDGPVDVQRGAKDGVITLGTGESWSGRVPGAG